MISAGIPAAEYEVQVLNGNQPTGLAAAPQAGSLALFDPAEAVFYDFFESGSGQWTIQGDWGIVALPDGNQAMTDSP